MYVDHTYDPPDAKNSGFIQLYNPATLIKAKTCKLKDINKILWDLPLS